MGFFVFLVGKFECVRCGHTSNACIQTKLLRHEAENSCREYHVGDADALVGLDNFLLLEPWDGKSPLVVAVGDWECSHCGLNWQWARVVFDVMPTTSVPVVTLREIVGLQPRLAADLAGVHFAEFCLAELSDLLAPPFCGDMHERLVRWKTAPLIERCETIAAGYRNWCCGVAQVSKHGDQDTLMGGSR